MNILISTGTLSKLEISNLKIQKFCRIWRPFSKTNMLIGFVVCVGNNYFIWPFICKKNVTGFGGIICMNYGGQVIRISVKNCTRAVLFKMLKTAKVRLKFEMINSIFLKLILIMICFRHIIKMILEKL